MTNSRLKLHKILKDILGTDHVYFQPPASNKITYPAILYERNSIDKVSANNNPYLRKYSYVITVMDKNPDSPIVDQISQLSNCKHDRHYCSDNINHDVFTIYF